MMFSNIADKLISELKAVGIEAYIWHKTATGSVYIRFANNRMCSIRIGDHEGRSKLKYKYNLRSDISSKHKQWVKDDTIWRFYLPVNKWKELIPVLIDRHSKIQGWDSGKYSYIVPSFKKA